MVIKMSVSCFLPSAVIKCVFITMMRSPSSKHTGHFCHSLSFWLCYFLFYFEVLPCSVCFPALFTPHRVPSGDRPSSLFLFCFALSFPCPSVPCVCSLPPDSSRYFWFVLCLCVYVRVLFLFNFDSFNSNHLESEPNRSFVTLLNKRLIQPIFVTVFNTFLSSFTTVKTSPIEHRFLISR